MRPRSTQLAVPLLFALTCALGCQSPTAPAPLRDQSYAQRGELELLADVHRPSASEPAPAVILVHGGSWTRGTRGRMERIARAMAEHGFVAVNIEYRLAPEHPFPAPLEDVLAAVCWVRRNAIRLHVDPGRIALWGYSAGAHLSALAASRPEALHPLDRRADADPRVQACVLGAGPSDLRPFGDLWPITRFLGGTPSERPRVVESASPVLSVHPQSPPTFLYHGRDDWVVDVQHARALRQALTAQQVPVQLLETERGHLTQLLCPDNVLPHAISFLERWLPAEGRGRALKARARLDARR